MKTSHSYRKPIPILFEDDMCVVFQKPPGLLVIPNDKKVDNTLVQIVNFQYAQEADYKLHPCHRLDKETSGVILFAKGKKQQQVLMQLFKDRKIEKRYLALVHGHIVRERGQFSASIASKDQLKYGSERSKKPALTKYKRIQQFKDFALVEIDLVTGRSNQIRIHFSQAGHPLLGERKYAIAKNYSVKFKRTALHASMLEWLQPGTQKKVHVTANLPEDIQTFLDQSTKRSKRSC